MKFGRALLDKNEMALRRFKREYDLATEGFFEMAFPLLTRFTEESFVCQTVAP